MSFVETVLLGAIAGLTIFLGLPVARMRHTDDRVRVGLAMLSVGVLAFVFMDVSNHAQAIVSTSVGELRHHQRSLGHVLLLFLLLAAGFTAGTAGIAEAQGRIRRWRMLAPPIAGGATTVDVAPEELPDLAQAEAAARRRALGAGLTIAMAIGLHNFAEGLAIGVSARSGAIGLATVLIIGFSLHNATEGFGIVGPLGGVRPSWRWIGLAGLIGGGPTFLGTVVGYQVHSDPLELAFYAMAGGAIIYVIGEIWSGMRRYGHRTLGLYMLSLGFLVGVATDLIVSYGGG